jgi:chromosome segregation ATPase
VGDNLAAETDAHTMEVKQAEKYIHELRDAFEKEKLTHTQSQKKVQALDSQLEESKVKSNGLKDELRVLNEQLGVKDLDMVSSQKRIDKLNQEIVKAYSVADKEKEKIMTIKLDMANNKNKYLSSKDSQSQE